MFKWTKKDINKIKEVTNKAIEKYNLQGWTIYHEFRDGVIELQDDGDGTKSYTNATAAADHRYEKVHIVWMPGVLREIKRKNEIEVRDIVFHEMAHCVTKEIMHIASCRYLNDGEIPDAIERLTQRITRIALGR